MKDLPSLQGGRPCFEGPSLPRCHLLVRALPRLMGRFWAAGPPFGVAKPHGVGVARSAVAWAFPGVSKTSVRRRAGP